MKANLNVHCLPEQSSTIFNNKIESNNTINYLGLTINKENNAEN